MHDASCINILTYYTILSFPDLWKFCMGNGLPAHLDKLQAIQNKFIKSISFSDKYDSPYPLFHIHSILKISDIIKLQIASFVYESRMRLSTLEFHTYFTSISELYIVMVQDSLLLKIIFSLGDQLHSMVYSS